MVGPTPRRRPRSIPQDVSPDGQWLLYLEKMQTLGILPLRRRGFSAGRKVPRTWRVLARRAVHRVPVQRVGAERGGRAAGADIRFHGQEERVGVREFYEGQEFLYRLVKELAR